MSAVGEVVERNDRPAYVRFKRVAVENKVESLRQGKYVAADVDYAMVTPPYSKDCVEMKVSQWRMNLEQDVLNGRIPKEWADNYLKIHDAWKNGQEIPLEGTPIRGWGVISPAQQEMLTHIQIMTVEDLAAANDEGMRRIGMGGNDLKTKARAWIAQLQDKGPLTQKLAAVESENAALKGVLENLQKQVEELKMRLPAEKEPQLFETENSITANDILPESEQPNRRKK